jgi:hypothetical protein
MMKEDKFNLNNIQNLSLNLRLTYILLIKKYCLLSVPPGMDYLQLQLSLTIYSHSSSTNMLH